MTTVSLENDQLSNNRLEVFKSLSINNINIIARISDGYINLNQICKAGEKEFKEWKRNKKSKAFLEALSKGGGIPAPSLIKYEIGSKTDQANWGHPQVAINVAQWVSPEFDVKVSKFVFELMLFGKVELGQEKSNKELELKFQEQIKLLTQEKDLLTQEKDLVSQQLLTVTRNHQNILKRRKRDLYEIGNVVYIVSHDAFTQFYQDNYHKIGIATQTKAESIPSFTGRLSTYNTGAPGNYKVHFLMYIEDNKLVEDILKQKFKDNIEPGNKEWIKSIKLEDIIDFVRKLCHFIGLPYKEHKIIEEFEEEQEESEEVDEEEEDEEQEEEEEEDEDDEEEEDDEIEKDKILKKISGDIKNVTLVELKEYCKKYFLVYTGNKPDLLARLKLYFETGEKKRYVIETAKEDIKRQCRKCNKKKEISMFKRHGPNGHNFLCLECDKHVQRKIDICMDCNVILDDINVKKCVECSNKNIKYKERPSYERLNKDLVKMSYVACGIKYGVSDNAIRKWLRTYEGKPVRKPVFKV